MSSSSSSASNASTSREILIRVLKLITFLVILPAAITAANLCFTLQRHGILLVESMDGFPSSLESSFTGIYWSMSPSLSNSRGAAYVRHDKSSNQHKLGGLLPAWPSISQVASSLVKRDTASTSKTPAKLEYWNKYESYCFKSTDHMICPTTEKYQQGLTPPQYSDWKVAKTMGTQLEDPDAKINLRIRLFQWFKPYYLQKQEKPFQQLVQLPATCLLLALNIGLAYKYWNHRVNPNQVALMDGPILQQFQYWRAITGSLAHFEWWHLLFNMMSLHNLGQFLEEQYFGSINFLLYNLALIPLTVLIFLGGIHLVYAARVRLRAHANNNNSVTLTRPGVNAVGYSGVLFAWMVVSSLEQTRSCPIPFMSQLCFDTWHITKFIKFNVGPLIQLVIAQVILPRVSFGGHLAGIIAGFLLHWNLLPLELVQPSVLIPLLTLVQWKHRQFIPISINGSSGNELGSGRNFLDEAGIDDDDISGGETAKPTSPKVPCLCPHSSGVVGMAHLLSTLLYALLLLFLGSIVLMSWSSSLLYAQGVLLVLFYCCYQSYTDHWDDEGEQDQWSPTASQKKQRMLVLWKGCIASCVLVLVLEAMTLASWILMGAAMFPHHASWGLYLLLALIAAHLVGLSIACKHWEGIGGEQEEKGIFEYTLGFSVLSNAKVLGRSVLSLWTSSMGCRRLSFNRSLASSSISSSPGRRPQSGDRTKSMAAAAAERRARVAESEIV